MFMIFNCRDVKRRSLRSYRAATAAEKTERRLSGYCSITLCKLPFNSFSFMAGMSKISPLQHASDVTDNKLILQEPS